LGPDYLSLARKSLDRKPKARRAKILNLNKHKKEFSIKDVTRTLMTSQI
jgi:hypothetical protein